MCTSTEQLLSVAKNISCGLFRPADLSRFRRVRGRPRNHEPQYKDLRYFCTTASVAENPNSECLLVTHLVCRLEGVWHPHSKGLAHLLIVLCRLRVNESHDVNKTCFESVFKLWGSPVIMEIRTVKVGAVADTQDWEVLDPLRLRSWSRFK